MLASRGWCQLPSKEVQQKILIELPIYKRAGNMFGDEQARANRNTTAPGEKL